MFCSVDYMAQILEPAQMFVYKYHKDDLVTYSHTVISWIWKHSPVHTELLLNL